MRFRASDERVFPSSKVYSNCEHLMIVAEALPDVFAFFEGALRTE